MKKLLVFPLAIYSHLLFAGGFSGGGPPPLILEPGEILRAMSSLLVEGDSGLELPAKDFCQVSSRCVDETKSPPSVSGGDDDQGTSHK